MALRFRKDAEPEPRAYGAEATVIPVAERGPGRRIAIGVGILFVALIGLAYGYDRVSAGHFYPGTRIGGVAVGSMSLAEAERLVRDRYEKPLRVPMTLSAPEYRKRATPWDMGMRLEIDNEVRDALVRQQAKGLGFRMFYRVVGDPSNIRLRPAVNDKVFDDFLERTFNRIDQNPQDARLEVTGDELKVVPHVIGRTVDKERARGVIFAALTAGDREVDVPVKTVEPALRTEAFKRVILISTGSNTLNLYRDGKRWKGYRVATGTGGYPTPHGQFTITAKRMNPTWYNPYSDWSQGMPAFIPPGPNNPLGTRALNLSASGIRIHGTPDAWSIGTNASHGCIRMHMRDVEQLFELVEVGTPVLVTS